MHRILEITHENASVDPRRCCHNRVIVSSSEAISFTSHSASCKLQEGDRFLCHLSCYAHFFFSTMSSSTFCLFFIQTVCCSLMVKIRIHSHDTLSIRTLAEACGSSSEGHSPVEFLHMLPKTVKSFFVADELAELRVGRCFCFFFFFSWSESTALQTAGRNTTFLENS